MVPLLHLILRDRGICERLQRLLVNIDCVFSVAESGAPFWDTIRQKADMLIVSRDALPEPYRDAIQTIRELPDEPDVVVILDEEEEEAGAELLAVGCIAVIPGSTADETLQRTMANLVERCQAEIDSRLQLELRSQHESRLSDFASSNPKLQSFIRTVRRVVQVDSSLLILGETGVGKERLARSIHEESPRGEKPFVPVNCAAFPESLLEGELFGHTEGAFTGATSDRRGYFEMAHGGTLFLDEIGEVPRHVQVKLLRVIQERQIQRLGSEDLIPIDVRIMAATNRDLSQEIQAGRFRRDLYYRLSVVTLNVPPLREHAEDIPLLLDRYLEEMRITLRKNVRGYAPIALKALCEYSWPGNVRELINVVERAVLLCDGNEITLADLPPDVGAADPGSSEPTMESSTAEALPLPDRWQELHWRNLKGLTLANLEQAYLEHHLRAAKGRIAETARATGLSTRALYLMMKRHGLRKEDFKPSKSRSP